MHHQYTSAVVARFWAKVDSNGPIPPHRPELGPCWVWTASRTKGGYGQFWTGQERLDAHRFSWLLHYGAIIDGLFVLHHCDNRTCVRPSHLWLGTQKANLADMVQKGRRQSPWLRLPGEANHNAKLTTEDVLAIRAAYAAGGITQVELAARYCVHQTVISRVLLRQTWAHLGG